MCRANPARIIVIRWSDSPSDDRGRTSETSMIQLKWDRRLYRPRTLVTLTNIGLHRVRYVRYHCTGIPKGIPIFSSPCEPQGRWSHPKANSVAMCRHLESSGGAVGATVMSCVLKLVTTRSPEPRRM